LQLVSIGFKYVNMTDITRDASRGRRTPQSVDGGAARSGEGQAERDHLITHVELLFFAYRDFTGDPDAVLSQYGFGRAHHRVLHFVHRNPGLRVANLLEILKITKQSLARVLKQLIGEGFVTQRAGAEDRRERLLYVTVKGARLAEKLTTLQIKRVETALAKAGPGADAAMRRFLLAMIAEADRPQVEALVRMSSASPSTGEKGNRE
jgi:DNA-binding MarR family transcriptional regulator